MAKQEEVTTKKSLEVVRNTVKVAVLKEGVIKDLVDVSIYDTQAVYLLSSACEGIDDDDGLSSVLKRHGRSRVLPIL